MRFEKRTLENGLRVVISPLVQVRSASIAIFIKGGSRFEKPEETGIAHFVEHMCFKGTGKRATAREIAEAVEEIGGIINGHTDKEVVWFWAKVPSMHFRAAFEIITDILLNPRFDPAEIEKERRVVIEELNASLDSPRSRVDMLIDELLWPDHPLGRDSVGTLETIQNFSQEMILNYRHNFYKPSNAVVSVAGRVDPEEAFEIVREMLGGWTAEGERPSILPFEGNRREPEVKIEYRETEQAHLCLGIPAFSYFHPDRFALDLLNTVLGEGLCSRLFLSLREEKGLVYDVRSYVDLFADTGAVIIYAGTDPNRIEEVLKAILRELSLLREEKISERELRRIKEFNKGRLLLRLEDSRNVAMWTGGQEILLDRIYSPEEVLEIVERVTPEDIRRVAQDLFRTENLKLALVGPLRDEERFRSLLSID